MQNALPVRLSPGRLWLYGFVFAYLGVAQLRFSSMHGYWDWPVFHAAARLVGSKQLMGTGFVYMPGFAWILKPWAYLPVSIGFWINAAIMFAVAVLCGFFASRVYRFPTTFCILATLAWTPALYALVIGQNGPLGLLLLLIAVAYYANNRRLATGLSIGMLLYKPTYAFALVVLMVYRREWFVLAVIAACGALWYIVSAAALGSNFIWPLMYFHALAAYYGADFWQNAAKAVSLPAILQRIGIPLSIAIAFALALLLFGLGRVSRMDAKSSMSVTALLGLACSPHAWTYDAVMMLPAVFWAMGVIPEPRRTLIVCASYIVGATCLLVDVLPLNPLALLVVGAAIAVVSSKPHPALATAV